MMNKITLLIERPSQLLAKALIAFGILIRIPLLFFPLTYASDTWRQADTASIAYHFLVNGFRILFPQIFWGGNGPGYVESEFQLYPFIVALLYSVFGEHLILGRLVSLTFSLVTMLLFYKLARGFLTERESLWSLFLFVISPVFVRFSVAYMPEATVMSFYVAALLLFLNWLRERKTPTLMWAAVMTSLAILVKPTSIHIGLIFALLLIGRDGFAALKKKEMWVAGILSLLPGALWYAHARNIYFEYGNTFGLFSGGDSKFGSPQDWFGAQFYISIATLETYWVLAGIGVILFALGFVNAVRTGRGPLIIVGTVAVLIYYMIVARYARGTWGIQYHVYALPYAALGVGIGSEWLLARLSTRLRLVVGPVIFFGMLAFSGYIYGRMLAKENNHKGKELIECAGVVKECVPDSARIIVSTTQTAFDHGIPNNYQEPTVFFYAKRYGWSLPAEWHTPEKVEEYRRAGATFLVLPNERFYRRSPRLVEYITEHADQIGPGFEKGCAVFRFK